MFKYGFVSFSLFKFNNQINQHRKEDLLSNSLLLVPCYRKKKTRNDSNNGRSACVYALFFSSLFTMVLKISLFGYFRVLLLLLLLKSIVVIFIVKKLKFLHSLFVGFRSSPFISLPIVFVLLLFWCGSGLYVNTNKSSQRK